MPSDRLSILYNPSAGMGRALGHKIRIERLLRHFEIRYDLVMTRNEEHLRELTRAHARTYPAVVGVGGDSTFHIMIGEMAAVGNPVGGAGGADFGMIGVGSSNDIPREFGIETLFKACRALKDRRTRKIDLGVVKDGDAILGGFLGQANIGLGAYVNRYVAGLAERRLRLARRQILAGVLGVRRAYKSKAIPLEIILDSEAGRREGAYAAAVFSNIRYWATGRLINPGARPDDGLLDCCLIGDCRFPRLARISRLAKAGRHVDARGVEILRAPRFRVSSGTPFAVQVDGEILRAADGKSAFANVSIEVIPGGLSLIAP
jgi:diacylglycerol kinase family enzyme